MALRVGALRRYPSKRHVRFFVSVWSTVRSGTTVNRIKASYLTRVGARELLSKDPLSWGVIITRAFPSNSG